MSINVLSENLTALLHRLYMKNGYGKKLKPM